MGAAPPVKDCENTVTIKPFAPFNFERTLRFILRPPAGRDGREFEPLLDYYIGGEFRRVAEINGDLALYGVSVRGPEEELRVRILSGPAGKSTMSKIECAVRRQLATDLDLAPFQHAAAHDPILFRLAQHFRGMRIPQAPSAYEVLVSAILEQQINLSFAHKVKHALIENYGRSIEYDGVRYNVFPSPETLAAATPEDLRKIQISRSKAGYVIAISRAVAKGSLHLESLRSLAPEAAHEKLMALKGVGAWTAQYAGMRAFGHLDCLPAVDVGLQKVVKFLYGLRKQPSVPRLEHIARKWQGWRSYATFYFWMTYWEDKEWNEKLRTEARELRRDQRTHAQDAVLS
ncbi:MAG: DNA-3-methyladenine glycosylase 2 family protein [Acidobacteriota bacterium]|nr:DNA-3-methyladenine glycosylase 2 family protein [Acidobacteriota bacterium]